MKSTLMRITFIFLAALFLFMSNPSYSLAEKRVALLIGNSNYDVGRLRNPVTDATDMAASLKKLGFSVILQNDADHKAMETAIKEFGRQLKKDTVGLFFYAGHGVQIDGRNYLIPLGANIEEEADVKYKAVNINRVFDVMDSAGNKLNIVILDACRDNPYAKSFRTSSRGLAMVGKSPNDTLIAYSTGPGDVASDGSGRNSPYTRALLDNINRSGLSIEQVFKKVRNDLDNTTGGRQKPWYTASLGTDFYFNPGKIKKSDEVNQLTTAKEIAPEDELENEKRKLDADQRRLEDEKAAFIKQKALEEKKRKIEEESERIAAQKDAARQVEADRKKQALEEKRRQIAEEKTRLAAEKEAARQAGLERKQAKKTLAMAPRPSVSTANVIRRDGRFVAYSNGTVLDTSTNLMWAAKDNGSAIDWHIAKSYCENYRGGGYSDWRMPTQDEMAGLYDASKSRPGKCDTPYPIHVATELIDITCFGLLTSDTRGSGSGFGFYSGNRYWGPADDPNYPRVLPVRRGK